MSQLAKLRANISQNNHWLEYGFLSLTAILLVLLSLKVSPAISLGIAALGFGLTMLAAFFVNIEIGFYSLIALGFLVASLDRMTGNRLPLISSILMIPFLLFTIMLFKEGRKKESSWFVWHPIVYVYLLMTAYLIFEIFNFQMDSFLGWLSAFWQRVAYILFFFVACYIFKDLKRIRFFFMFAITAIFLTGLYGCIQQWVGLTPWDRRWLSDPRIYGLFSLPGQGLRKFSTLSDPANFGTLMAGGTVATVILFLGSFQKKIKILLAIFTVFISLGMSYSGTRTANLIMAAGLALYILMTLYKKRTQIAAFLGGLAFLFILYAPIYGNVTLNRFRSAFYSPEDDASYNVRLIHREMMQPYMHRYPFGGGVNTVGAPGAKYNPNHFLAGFPPDGAYFSVALQMGWVGFAINCLFDFLICAFCVHYFYKCKNEEIKTYYAAMVGMLFALFLGEYAQFTVSSIPQSLIFVPFLACIVKLHTFDTPNQQKLNNKI